MDWSRAKNIILVLLLFLNVFLFINIINVKKTFGSSSEYRAKAQQALAELGLEINCPLPSNNKPVQRISFVEKDKNVYTEMIRSLMETKQENLLISEEGYYYTNGKTLKFIDNKFIFTDSTNIVTIPVDNQKRLDMTLKSWIRKNKISDESFVLNRIDEKDGTVIVEYVQLYKKMPVFNNKIVFTIENKVLVQVEGSIRIFYDLKVNKEDDAVSAEVVLLMNKDRIGAPVESIDLGYFLAQKDELYDTPVWRVRLSTGDDVLFNAFTGEWMSNSY